MSLCALMRMLPNHTEDVTSHVLESLVSNVTVTVQQGVRARYTAQASGDCVCG